MNLKIQKTPTRPLELDFWLKNISGNIRDIEKKLFYFEALFTAYIIPWKTQFNLTYFKLYGNLKHISKWLIIV